MGANSTKKSTAAASLAAGLTHRETAEAAGIGKSTLVRWLHDDADFLAELADYRGIVRDHLHGRLTGVAGEAFAVLVELLRTAESEQVRARVALALLDRGMDMDIDQRLDALAAQLDELEGNR